MIKTYQRVANETDIPAELSRRVFYSIRLYLQEYRDTSRTKEDRKKSIDAAYVITEWVVQEIVKHIDSFEKDLIYFGFCKIFATVAQAKTDFSKVQDVTESIGFLKILEG